MAGEADHSLKGKQMVEAVLLLRKEGRLSEPEVKCSWKGEGLRGAHPGEQTAVPREATGRDVFSEEELARPEEVESGHGLKKLCGSRNIGGSPMTSQPEVASVSSSCSYLRFLYISQVVIPHCILNAPPCGLAEGRPFLFLEALTQPWHRSDIKLGQQNG